MATMTLRAEGSEGEALIRADAGEYDLVRRAIAYLSSNWSEQPDLSALARHLGLSPTRCQKLFKQWCGLSPKAFVQAVTIERARAMLDTSASLMDTAHEVGLSGASRLHDLFVTHEAMSPGDYKRRGAGLEIVYGFYPSPFGIALIMSTPRGICGLSFADSDGDCEVALADMKGRWPAARYRHCQSALENDAERIFVPESWRRDQPIRLVLIGSDFEIRVWRMLLQIPSGRLTTYSTIAEELGKPTASRAVGSAVGRNPISFVVPCHRVLRRDGGLGGYHWGITRKQAIIGWERGRMS